MRPIVSKKKMGQIDVRNSSLMCHALEAKCGLTWTVEDACIVSLAVMHLMLYIISYMHGLSQRIAIQESTFVAIVVCRHFALVSPYFHGSTGMHPEWSMERQKKGVKEQKFGGVQGEDYANVL